MAPPEPRLLASVWVDSAKEGAGQGVVGIAEIWMVEDVEELGSETKTDLLGEMKLPL